jgi:hypothetical protein
LRVTEKVGLHDGHILRRQKSPNQGEQSVGVKNIVNGYNSTSENLDNRTHAARKEPRTKRRESVISHGPKPPQKEREHLACANKKAEPGPVQTL